MDDVLEIEMDSPYDEVQSQILWRARSRFELLDQKWPYLLDSPNSSFPSDVHKVSSSNSLWVNDKYFTAGA